MRLREWIRSHRDQLDFEIQNVSPGAPKNDEERELWVLNSEWLYSWAKSDGVRI